jgi:hypothetical protein
VVGGFCDMRPSRASWGFLTPYLPQGGTLHSAASDVRRCSEFNMCPVVHFHVGGRTVDAPRVRTYVANEDSMYRCWVMGYLLDIDCADVDKEESQMCVVDCLVLPLVSIIFPTD